MAQWKQTWMRPQDIKVEPQIRKDNDPSKQEELNASVKAHGILMPLLVMISGILLAGHRRLIAALAAGLETVPVIITDRLLSDSEVLLIQLAENVHRADLSGYEKWQACAQLMQINPNWPLKELAAHLHLDPSMVTRLISPSKCIEAAQAALREGRIGISDCYAISKLPVEDQASLLSQKLSGASRDAIEQAGRKNRTKVAPAVRLSRVKIAMPEGKTVVLTGPEMSLDEVITALESALSAARRAHKDNLDVKTAEKVWRDRARAG